MKDFIKKILPPSKVSEMILGGQDGLVNTFGVILGIAAASYDIRIVVAGGLAATFAESISMGAVSYTSQRAEKDRYIAENNRVRNTIQKNKKAYSEILKKIYMDKGFSGKDLGDMVKLTESNENSLVETILHDHLNLSRIDSREVLIDAFIVFLAAFIGALVPLTPFFFLDMLPAIITSCIFSVIVLFIFGYYKGKVTIEPLRSAVELAVIGSIAASLGYFIGFLFK
jgi:vacuolar iron transporter family protein